MDLVEYEKKILKFNDWLGISADGMCGEDESSAEEYIEQPANEEFTNFDDADLKRLVQKL